MSREIELVKTQNACHACGAAVLRGYGEDNDRAWKRFKAWVKNLAPGEFLKLSYTKPRNVRFHRKFFALLKIAFDHWEPESGRRRLTYKGRPIEKNFERFRKDLIILAGHYEPSYDLRGRLRLEAKSIAFDKMEEDDFEKLYEGMVDVVLRHILTNYKREDLDRVVAEVERFGQ